jgi:adenylate cyclase
VARLANTLGFELVRAEAGKSTRSANPDAVDLVMRGFASAQQSPPTKDAMNAARASFDQALKIDPNDGDALAGEAFTYFVEYARWANPETDYDARVLGLADRAIALAPDNLWSYFAKSVYLYSSRRPDQALDAADAGLAVNANSGSLRAARGRAETFLGQFEPSKADLLQAMRLSPRDPFIGVWHWYLGDTEFGLGHVDVALDEYKRSFDAGYRAYFVYESMAAAYALKGRMDEAKSALAEAQRLQTPLVVKWWIIQMPNIPSLVEGLRKAGLPEACDPRSHTGFDARPC